MSRTLTSFVLTLALLGTSLAAQRQVGAGAQGGGIQGGGVQGSGGPQGGRFGQPARDAVEQATGTAVIRGRVVAADTGTPVRRAQVRAVNNEGRFLAAGRWHYQPQPQG